MATLGEEPRNSSFDVAADDVGCKDSSEIDLGATYALASQIHTSRLV